MLLQGKITAMISDIQERMMTYYDDIFSLIVIDDVFYFVNQIFFIRNLTILIAVVLILEPPDGIDRHQDQLLVQQYFLWVGATVIRKKNIFSIQLVFHVASGSLCRRAFAFFSFLQFMITRQKKDSSLVIL